MLVTNVLNRMLSKAVDDAIIEGTSVGRQGVTLSHMQFADNTIMFAPTKYQVLLNIRRSLSYYDMMSGLKINYEKSAIIPMKVSHTYSLVIKLHGVCALIAANGGV